MSDTKDEKKKKAVSETEKKTDRTGRSGKNGSQDAVLQKKARELTDDFAKDPFIARDSAAMELLQLRTQLQNMLLEANGDMKPVVEDLLGQTEMVIDTAKKTGKMTSVSSTVQAINQQTQNLAKQIDSLENKLGGYKIKYVMDYQKNLQGFEDKWVARFSVPMAFVALNRIQEEKKENNGPYKSWDDYMDAALTNVPKGKENERLAKAMSAVILKNQKKEFSLEEADKLAKDILKSKAFKQTFGKNGKLTEQYLKDRNISQAIILMNTEVDKRAVKELEKQNDKKYKEFNKFIGMHPALKLGYEILSGQDAQNGTHEVQKMINDLSESKLQGEEVQEMTEAKIMTQLLKQANRVLQAAHNEPENPEAVKNALQENVPVLKRDENQQ